MTKENGLIVDPRGRPVLSTSALIEQGALSLEDMAQGWEQTVFCLDGSGSMADHINYGDKLNKLDLLKKAMDRYLRERYKKNPGSRVGLVVFESDARTLIDVTDNEQLLLNLVAQLSTGGSTKMDRGLALALGVLRRSAQGWIPRIVLISDGQPDSQEAVVAVIDGYRDMRVIVDAIYIGPPKEQASVYVQFMKLLAEKTGGVFEMITNAEDFERKFLEVAQRPLLTAGNPLGGV